MPISPPQDSPRPVWDHLDELRFRLITCLVWFLGLSVAGYFFVDDLLLWLTRPVGWLIFTEPTEALFIKFKIAGALGFLAGMPVYLTQAWRFIGVALAEKEKTAVILVAPAVGCLFLAGTTVAVLGVAPAATRFLLGFATNELRPFITAQAYFDFLFWMIVGFGLLFQIPLILIALCQLGIVDPAVVRLYRRQVLVGLLIACAVLTPGPDIFSQLLLMAPSYVLFEIALFISHRLYKRKTSA